MVWLLCVAALSSAVAGCSRDSGPSEDAGERSTGGITTTETGLATPPATSTEGAKSGRPYVGYPNSIAVLAHSGATGENSDPHEPRAEVRENSWATGTNPAVKSLYVRILARNSKIKGHNFNLAQGGANVDELVFQAEEAVELEPRPDLIVIQIGDNDIVCPVSADDLRAFRSSFESALDVLAKGTPTSRLFVVSQFGSPTTYAKALTQPERQSIGGTGPCDFVDPSGRLAPGKLANLEEAIHGYEAQLEAGCKRFPRCRYDGGAFGRVVETREFFSSDLNHLSVKGHAKAAAVAWAALKRAGLVPRSA